MILQISQSNCMKWICLLTSVSIKFCRDTLVTINRGSFHRRILYSEYTISINSCGEPREILGAKWLE